MPKIALMPAHGSVKRHGGLNPDPGSDE